MTYGEIRESIDAELKARSTFEPGGNFDISHCLVRLRDWGMTFTQLHEHCPQDFRSMLIEATCDGLECILQAGFVRDDGKPACKVETVEQGFEELRGEVTKLSQRVLRTKSVYWLNTGGCHFNPSRPAFYLLLFAKNVQVAIDAWTHLDSDFSGYVTLLAVQAAVVSLLTCLLTCY